MPDNLKTFRLAYLTSALLAASLIAGCTQPTPYAPAVDGKGYKEQQLETDRYRVSFTGNSATPRETVENYLLYRAAEVTLQSGHDHFRVVTQEIESETVYRTTLSGINSFGFSRFRYHYQPFFADLATGSSRPITSYEALANIIVIAGEPNQDDDQTYDARDVVEKLGPTIVRPQAGAN